MLRLLLGADSRDGTLVGAGASGACVAPGATDSGAGGIIESSGGIGAGAGGASSGILSSGISMDCNGAIGSGAGMTASTFGSGKGPTGSPSSPVSPSGTEDGAATGSENTGSILVVLVMSSIAFCRSLSTV